MSVLGETIGQVCAGLHRTHGVDVRCGVAVQSCDGSGRVEQVCLSDGSRIAADLVVIGLGVTPATQWLEGSGLALDDGVLCDEYCSTGVAGVFVAGDVARWPSGRFGGSLRIEHWTNAVEQGRVAARNLLARSDSWRAYDPVPYFWSDQFDVRIQCLGQPAAGDELQLEEGSLESDSFLATYRRNHRVVGAVGFNSPASIGRYRRIIADAVPV